MRRLSAFLLLANVVACENHPTLPITTPQSPVHAIFDAAHGGGNPHFYFMPPMVPASPYEGAFDASVSPTVTICEWSGDACLGDPVATYTMTTGLGSEVVRLDVTQEQYIVNWHTGRIELDSAATYRIKVVAGGYTLGFADIDIYATRREAKSFLTNAIIPLKDGVTLPISFRIEEGAVPTHWGEYGVTIHRIGGDFFINGSGQQGGSVNSRGQVAGNAYADGYYQAAVYTARRGVTFLGTLGGRVSSANSINDAGQVVGSSHIGSGPTGHETHAFLYTGGSMRDLGTLGGEHSYAYGINDIGEVVGRSEMDFFHSGRIAQFVFLVNQDSMQDLGTLGGSFGQANGINEHGHVVGFAIPSDRRSYRAFIWADGSMLDLGSLDGGSSAATAINNAGQVVGHSSTRDLATGNQVTHAFLFSNGILQDLGTLGGKDSYAVDVDESGTAVGYAMDATDTFRGTLWFDAGDGRQAYRLDDLVNTGDNTGWVLSKAIGISSDGRYILAQGSNGLGSIYDYVLLEANPVSATSD